MRRADFPKRAKCALKRGIIVIDCAISRCSGFASDDYAA